ncbi:MAG: hypothetical protein IJU25_04715, partial [Lachnospiraceae bacterium]|nr:hypothetical protein [Lachnospiraceae bacterium]
EQGEEYANLMAYLKNPRPTDPLTRDIAAAVEVLRDRRDLRREYVTFQEIIDKEKEISKQEGIAETLQKLSAALNKSEEELQELLNAKESQEGICDPARDERSSLQ